MGKKFKIKLHCFGTKSRDTMAAGVLFSALYGWIYEPVNVVAAPLPAHAPFPRSPIVTSPVKNDSDVKAHYLKLSTDAIVNTLKPTIPGQITTHDAIALNMRISALYKEMYLSNPFLFKWAGMAAHASESVGDGLKRAYGLGFGDDSGAAGAEIWVLSGFGISSTDGVKLFWGLTAGNRVVFGDIYWQHLAYKNCGIAEIERAFKGGALDKSVYQAWKKIDEGRDKGNEDLIWEGNSELLYYEQHDVLQKNVYDRPEAKGLFNKISARVVSPVPNDKTRFQQYVPGGDISKFEDRWKWIKESMLPNWRKYEAGR